MSSNTITLRQFFLWNSNWFCDFNYFNLLFEDVKISKYLSDIFYNFKLPTSNFIIKRFLNEIIIQSRLNFRFFHKKIKKDLKKRKLRYFFRRNRYFFRIKNFVFKKSTYFFFKKFIYSLFIMTFCCMSNFKMYSIERFFESNFKYFYLFETDNDYSISNNYIGISSLLDNVFNQEPFDSIFFSTNKINSFISKYYKPIISRLYMKKSFLYKSYINNLKLKFKKKKQISHKRSSESVTFLNNNIIYRKYFILDFFFYVSNSLLNYLSFYFVIFFYDTFYNINLFSLNFFIYDKSSKKFKRLNNNTISNGEKKINDNWASNIKINIIDYRKDKYSKKWLKYDTEGNAVYNKGHHPNRVTYRSNNYYRSNNTIKKSDRNNRVFSNSVHSRNKYDKGNPLYDRGNPLYDRGGSRRNSSYKRYNNKRYNNKGYRSNMVKNDNHVPYYYFDNNYTDYRRFKKGSKPKKNYAIPHHIYKRIIYNMTHKPTATDNNDKKFEDFSYFKRAIDDVFEKNALLSKLILNKKRFNTYVRSFDKTVTVITDWHSIYRYIEKRRYNFFYTHYFKISNFFFNHKWSLINLDKFFLRLLYTIYTLEKMISFFYKKNNNFHIDYNEYFFIFLFLNKFFFKMISLKKNIKLLKTFFNNSLDTKKYLKLFKDTWNRDDNIKLSSFSKKQLSKKFKFYCRFHKSLDAPYINEERSNYKYWYKDFKVFHNYHSKLFIPLLFKSKLNFLFYHCFYVNKNNLFFFKNINISLKKNVFKVFYSSFLYNIFKYKKSLKLTKFSFFLNAFTPLFKILNYFIKKLNSLKHYKSFSFKRSFFYKSIISINFDIYIYYFIFSFYKHKISLISNIILNTSQRSISFYTEEYIFFKYKYSLDTNNKLKKYLFKDRAYYYLNNIKCKFSSFSYLNNVLFFNNSWLFYKDINFNFLYNLFSCLLFKTSYLYNIYNLNIVLKNKFKLLKDNLVLYGRSILGNNNYKMFYKLNSSTSSKSHFKLNNYLFLKKKLLNKDLFLCDTHFLVCLIMEAITTIPNYKYDPEEEPRYIYSCLKENILFYYWMHKTFLLWYLDAVKSIFKYLIFNTLKIKYLNTGLILFDKSIIWFLKVFTSFLFLNNIYVTYFRSFNNITSYYFMKVKDVNIINYIEESSLFYLRKNRQYRHYYIRYFILNLFYFFNSIENTISIYSNNNCFLFFVYSFRSRFFFNSAKMLCEFITLGLRRRWTIRKVFYIIKRKQSSKIRYKHRLLTDPNQIKNHVKLFFLDYKLPLKGIRILYSGNLRKAKRKRKISYFVWLSNIKYSGMMPLRKFKFYIDYHKRSVSLLNASVGIKVWLLFNLYTKKKVINV